MPSRLRAVLMRLAQAIPVVLGVVLVSFLLTRALPGDPAAYFAGDAATPESIAATRAKLGLDRSMPEQFLRYCGDLLRGDLGEGIERRSPRGEMVVEEAAGRVAGLRQVPDLLVEDGQSEMFDPASELSAK